MHTHIIYIKYIFHIIMCRHRLCNQQSNVYILVRRLVSRSIQREHRLTISKSTSISHIFCSSTIKCFRGGIRACRKNLYILYNIPIYIEKFAQNHCKISATTIFPNNVNSICHFITLNVMMQKDITFDVDDDGVLLLCWSSFLQLTGYLSVLCCWTEPISLYICIWILRK